MLRGYKVILRGKRWEDVTEDYEWKTNVELATLDAALPLNVSFSEFSRDFMNELIRTDLKGCRFSIDAISGKHIGNCTYYNLDKSAKQVEIGIMIGDPDYWAKGYGSEAVGLLIEYIFRETGLERVYLHTLDWNTRAQKSFRKCGFVPCGRRRRDGYDFIVMELYRSMWEEKQADSQSSVE